MPTLTLYPANGGLNTVGAVIRGGVNETWAVIRAGAGTSGAGAFPVVQMKTTTTTNQWEYLHRGIIVFPLTELPSGVTIISATFSLHGRTKADTLGVTPDINVYEADPADYDRILSGSDYGTIETTPFSTAIPYGSFDASGYNDFTLNDAGKLYISASKITVPLSKVAFGIRNASYDVSGTPPSWSSNKRCMLECHGVNTGDEFRPRLVLNYGSVYPSNTLSRTTGIIRRRSPGRDSMELSMGGIAPDPVTRFSFTPETAVPQAPPPLGATFPEATGMIGPFTDPVTGAEYWITIDGHIVYTSNIPDLGAIPWPTWPTTPSRDDIGEG